MSDSTTQPNKSAGASDANTSTFHRELNKKIRNKTKKITQIQDAETKIKAEGKQPTQAHITKLASVPSLEADIAEVKGYLDLYNQSQADFEKQAALVRKQHAKELGQARKAAVTTFVNMVSMHVLQDCGQKIPEEIEEGVAHFRDIVGKLSLRNESSGNWRVNRDNAISEWTKLSTASQDTIQHTEISYEDLVSGVVEAVSSGGYPEEVSKPKKEKKAKKSEPKQAEPEVQAPVEEAPQEVAQPEPVAVEEPVVAEPVAVEEPVTAEEPTPAAEEPVAVESEAVTETQPAEEEKAGERESNVRTRGDRIERRSRGDKPERGAYRGDKAERGERRGGRGRGDRGDRGDRRGRGRGTYVKRPYGEDAEGFITVKEDNEPAYRGRGRGRGGNYRGNRGGERGGERGGYRGERGAYRGDRAERGDRRGRGERPQRKGQEFAEGKQINEAPKIEKVAEVKVEAAPAE